MKKTIKPAKEKSARELLARNLRRQRADKKITQEALALAAGVNRKYVGQVESGARAVSIDIMDRLAHALEIPVGSLLDDV